MPTDAEILNQISTILHPTPFGNLDPSVTYRGVKVPNWEYFVTHPSAIIDRLDSALSSANGLLNFVLSPVRSFVGAVLSPLFSLADAAFGLVSDFIQSVFHKAVDLAYSAGDTIGHAVDYVSGLARGFVNDAINLLRSEAGALGLYLQGVITGVVNEARSLYAGAISFAQRVEADATQYARDIVGAASSALSGLVDTVRRDAAAWFNDAKNLAAQGIQGASNLAQSLVSHAIDLAQRAVDDLRQWASIAIRDTVGAAKAAWDAVYRDVIEPVVGGFTHFLAVEWKAAKALLGVLEDAAGWIVFVTTHAVPEIESTLEMIDHVAHLGIDDVVVWGARYGARIVG